MATFNTVAVIGAGAWGTALAGVAARAGREVTLWARNADAVKNIAASRINPKLPGVKLDADFDAAQHAGNIEAMKSLAQR